MSTMQESIKNANIGEYVKFGSYPQTVNGDIQPIEWQVLAKENDKLLLFSKYGLDCKRFDSSSNNWKNSEIRQWLNGEFYNKAFNEKDKKYIKSFDDDNIFLLSYEDAQKYFANYEAKKCKATEYAVKNGAYIYDDCCCWWLSSVLPIPNFSNCVYFVFNMAIMFSIVRLSLALLCG